MNIKNTRNKKNKNYNNKSIKKKYSLDNFILHIPNILKKNMNSYPKLYNVDINNFMPWSDISSHLIVTKNLKSQIYINNAMNLLYNFNQEEACNNFIFASILDPHCAFAFWGISYSLQLNINHIIIPSKILQFAVNAYKIAHKLKDDPLPHQTEQYKKLCESIDKNGMTHPIIVAGDMRVLRGNQRVWYCIDNNIEAIGAYKIHEQDVDKYIQKTYIHKDDYPL